MSRRKNGLYEETIVINQKRYHFYGKTKKEAVEKKKEFKELMAVCPLAEKKITLAEWCEAWLETLNFNVSKSTQRSYAQVLEHFIIKAPIGAFLLVDLRPQMFRLYWQKLLDEGKSSRTVIYCHTVTSLALKQAVIDGAIPANPLQVVKRPKLIKKEVKAMTADQLKLLLSSIDNPLYKNIIEVGARTGMRREEILGLTWPKIDLEEGILTVSKTVIRIDGKVTLQNSTKTKSSERSIYIDTETVRILREQKILYLNTKISNPKFKDLELVFFRPDGSPIHPDAATRWFKFYARKIGLGDFSFHSLRHTHATLLLEAGVDFKQVQDRLGHSSFSTTMDVYSHVTPAMKKEAMLTIENIL